MKISDQIRQAKPDLPPKIESLITSFKKLLKKGDFVAATKMFVRIRETLQGPKWSYLDTPKIDKDLRDKFNKTVDDANARLKMKLYNHMGK